MIINAEFQEVDKKLNADFGVLTMGVPTDVANALKKTVKGTAVAVDDASPITHMLDVKVESKNLFNNDTKMLLNDLMATSTGATGELEANNLCFVSDYIPIKPNSAMIINYAKRWAFYNEDKICVGGSEDKSSATQRAFTTPDNAYYLRFSCVTATNNGTGVQAEYGTVVTDYTPFIDVEVITVSKLIGGIEVQSATASADGTVEGLVSSPSFELTSNAMDGSVLIYLEYNKDINKVSFGGGTGTGEDGFSPIAKVEETTSGATITITDKNGTTSATVTNGKDGVSGKDGADGYTPQKNVDYFDGTDGKDGTSVTVKSVSESTADGGSNVVTFSDGKTLTVKNGKTGSKGDDGKDYVITSADKLEIKNDILEAIITQEAGESEILVMSQKAVTDLVNDALGENTTTEYETVDSVEEMTDTSKQYVLKETGTIWAYGEKEVEKEPKNVFVPSTATLNKRLSSSGESNANGMYITDYIEFDASTAKSPIIWLPTDWASTVDNQRILLANGNKEKLELYYIKEGVTTSGYLTIGQENGRYYVDISKAPNTSTNAEISTQYPQIKYVRIGLSSGVTTAITANDLADVEILFEKDRGTTTINEWYDTELEPSASGGGGGNYVELLVKVNKNTTDIAEVSNRVTALETGSETLTIPTFWQTAVDVCISKIKALQVGRNCVTFPFFSDNHQNIKYAGVLIAHIMKECNIPYCFFGGDSISNGIIADEATMIAQDKAFDTMMSYVPNGRFCRAVGNHDGFWNDGTNKYYYNRDQVYDLFLREESIAQNKHFGDDGTYYYVDDVASKVRFIVMNTNNAPVDSTQIAWVQNTALNITESGWGVVFISHQPISNHYHAGITNAAEVVSAVTSTASSKNLHIIGWFSGHIHRDIISTKRLTGGNGSNAGTEAGDLGFTQVIITSDHTSIAYDDATKHTVANDDQSHAIDFVTINKSTRTVNITRLGIGSDRSYTY